MKRRNLFIELMSFMWERKAYWIFPAVVFLILLIFVIIVGTSPVSGFVYTLF